MTTNSFSNFNVSIFFFYCGTCKFSKETPRKLVSGFDIIIRWTKNTNLANLALTLEPNCSSCSSFRELCKVTTSKVWSIISFNLDTVYFSSQITLWRNSLTILMRSGKTTKAICQATSFGWGWCSLVKGGGGVPADRMVAVSSVCFSWF